MKSKKILKKFLGLLAAGEFPHLRLLQVRHKGGHRFTWSAERGTWVFTPEPPCEHCGQPWPKCETCEGLKDKPQYLVMCLDCRHVQVPPVGRMGCHECGGFRFDPTEIPSTRLKERPQKPPEEVSVSDLELEELASEWSPSSEEPAAVEAQDKPFFTG